MRDFLNGITVFGITNISNSIFGNSNIGIAKLIEHEYNTCSYF